jgi:pSer/pThr/pTyr-binding forkhead associated (FHA) protein
VLAHHCSLVEDAGERYVEDHSGGGTRLNGERVEGRAVVRAGDRLSLGERGAELVLVAIEDDAR